MSHPKTTATIDPTKNVLDLVEAESKHRDELRAADNRYHDSMRGAETQRLNELAALRVYYEAIIEGMRSNSLKLLAEQLKENKADSSERTSKLEQFRWESGGRGLGATVLAGWILSGVMAIAAVAMYLKHQG